MRIIHITPWYPNKKNPIEALWIQRLIESLSAYAKQEIWLINVVPSDVFKIERSGEDENINQLICQVPTNRWLFLEIANFLILGYYLLIKRIHRNFDVINFHIAYPQLTYWHYLKHFVKKPVLVSEHWSAYHFNFGLPAVKDLTRIKRIFRNQFPLAVVSNALKKDIEKFSDRKMHSVFIVPNLVDTTAFFQDLDIQRRSNIFFMASQWKQPKDPFVVIEAFAEFVKRKEFILRIGGTGPQMEKMKQLVSDLKIEGNVHFLGRLTGYEMSKQMKLAHAFLHGSSYETFSVVCAEALCCGTPVIASAVGGIVDFVNNSNGILIPKNTHECWTNGLKNFSAVSFNHQSIAQQADSVFAKEAVAKLYIEAIKAVHNDYFKSARL